MIIIIEIIKHIYRLLFNNDFKNDILGFRKSWHENLHKYYDFQKFNQPPPVDFNDEKVKLINTQEISGFGYFENFWEEVLQNNMWEDYYENPQKNSDSNYDKIKKYIETKKDYNTICGYKFKYLDKTIFMYINKENTSQILWDQFKKILEKYKFPGYYYDIELLISNNPTFEESIIINHPLYSFISSICIFNSDYFFYPNKIIKSQKSSQTLDLNKNFNPKNFLRFYTEYITTINDLIIDYKTDKIKLKKISELLDNPEYSKKDINEELNSKKFINEKNSIIEKMKKEMPPLILFPGIIPRLRKHDDIFTRYLLKLDFADKPNRININRLIKTYPMVLDKKNGYTYLELEGLYNCVNSTAGDRVEDFCEFVNINKPN